MKKKVFLLICFFVLNFKVINSEEKILPIFEGSPDAKIKLIIYESMTCSHCADFHKKVYPSLKKNFIEKGLASIEFRNFPLDLAALNASKIVHCKNDGASNTMHFLYENQNKWVRGNNIVDINSNLRKLIEGQNFQINFEKCLNNKVIEDYVLEERINGFKKYDIQATPTLIINDKKFDKTLNYKNLEKKLKKML